MKKTPFVWIMIILGVINTVSGVFGIVSQFRGPVGGLDVVDILINIIATVVSIVYTYKLFKMQGNLLKWTNYTFGLDALSMVFPIIITPAAWPLYLEMLALVVIIWFFFYNHLKKLSVGSVK